jgi:type IV pilus biogenesis protein CpaD/CtpE
MVNQLRVLGLISITLALLAGCGSEPPTVGNATPFSAVCARENAGQRVAVDGYLLFPISFSKSQSVVLYLHETEAFDGAPLGVQMPFGTAPNQVAEVADQFTHEDLQVHLHDGTVAGLGTKVTVSGKVYFPLSEQVFPCGLENPLVELAD